MRRFHEPVVRGDMGMSDGDGERVGRVEGERRAAEPQEHPDHAAHLLLSGPAVERLRSLPIKEIVCTDTIPIPEEKKLPNMTVLTVAELLGEVIIRSHEGRSVGELFNE